MPASRVRSPNINMSSDEINSLIYAYLQDSGFEHSAYNLRSEARLDATPYAKTHIKRGVLVELLAKALLYLEVEAHWKHDAAANSCKVPFSLLKQHVCSSSATVALRQHMNSTSTIPPPRPELFPLGSDALPVNGVSQTAKRKASPRAKVDERVEKRARTVEPDSMQVDDATNASDVITKSDKAKGKEKEKPNAISIKKPKKPQPSKVPPSGAQQTEEGAITVLDGHDADVFFCAWNPKEPTTLATGSKDATARVWDISVAPSSSGKIEPKGIFKAPKIDFNPALYPFGDKPDGDIISGDWSPNGKLLATGSYDRRLVIWNMDGTIHMSVQPHKSPIFCVRFSPTGKYLLTCGLDGVVNVYDIAEKTLLRDYSCPGSCLDLDWLDERGFAVGTADPIIYIRSLAFQAPVQTFRGHRDEINQIRFSGDKTMLASCSDDFTARLWRVNFDLAVNDHAISEGEDPYCLQVLRGHTRSVSHITWCPPSKHFADKMLATSSLDGTARLWNADTGECVRTIESQMTKCFASTISLDARFIAMGGTAGTVYIFSLETGEKVFEWLDKEKGSVFDISWQRYAQGSFLGASFSSRKAVILDITKVPALAPSQ